MLTKIKDDNMEAKLHNYSHSFFIFCNQNVYFCFLARTEAIKAKLNRFYLDLKKDLSLVCKADLDSLQDENLTDGYYQRYLLPKLEERMNSYRSSINLDKVKVA